MPRLDSSAIRRVTYNPTTQKMNVQFVGKGKQYTFVGVPEDVYDDFVNSSSAGKFFNDNIKDDYIAVPSEFVGSVRFDSPDDEDFYEERNMSGKELNERFGFGTKKIKKTDAELVDIFKKQKSYTELLRRQEALARIKERGRLRRLPRDPDMIDPTFRKPVPQSFSRITGEDMSVSKDVLREFKFTQRPSPRLDPNFYRLGTEQTPSRFGGGASGRLPGIGLGALIGGLAAAGGSSLPPGTDSGREPTSPGGGGGSGSEPIQKLGFLARTIRYLGDKLLGVGVILGGIWGGYKLFIEESKKALGNLIDALPLSDEHKEWLKANMLLVVMSVGLLVGSAEAARRLTPRIMKVLRNRRIATEIGEALDSGDETMARTILLDAIEDENINLSAIRRKLGDDDYERLYRDYL